MDTSLTRHILVADDEPDILSEIIRYLRRHGEIVIAVTSFRQAVHAFNDNADAITLIITDVRMPDGNGAELVRWVIDRSQGKCECLLMTGDPDQADLGADLEAAGVRILYKPFGMSTLYAAVLSTLAPSPSSQAVSEADA